MSMDFQDSSNPYAVPTSPDPGEYQQTSGMAVASLVLGVLGFVFWIFTALPGIILGIVALVKIGGSGGRLGGKGLAIGGITTGSISLVCCGLIPIALLLPAVQAAREAARRNMSMNNMKEINLGLINYHDTNGTLPVAGADAQGNRPNLSWRVQILPSLGHQALYDQFHHDEPWDSPHNLSLLPHMPPEYKCPNVVEEGKTVYLAVTGPGAAFQGEDPGPSFRSFIDGISSTIWLVEANEDQAVEWTKPDDWELEPNNPWQGLGELRSMVVMAGFADGHVEAIDTSTPPETLKALMTRDGKEDISW
jgi:hypothetical protein